MKSHTNWSMAVATYLAASSFSSVHAINVPGDGSDGVLNITASTVIDLGQAVTANWDAANTANAGKGVYDPVKWAVVFKYSSINIAADATVTFKNHNSRAPVVWLATGDVTIAGTVSLNGDDAGYNAPGIVDGGPGGFRGGQGIYTTGVWSAPGFGPGGSQPGWYANGASGAYGNPSLVPLVGGSGGGGSAGNSRGGGGGGGAFLIATPGKVSITGLIRANGGNAWEGGAGSGGGVRIVAGDLSGSGVVQCLPGYNYNNNGGMGRVRLERAVNTSSFQVTPDPSIVPLEQNATPLIWLPETGPTAKIVKVGTVSTPSDPRAAFGSVGPDVVLPLVTSTQVVIETRNVEQASVVKVRATPRSNGNYQELDATIQEVVSTTPLVIRWVAELPVNAGYSAVQARVIRP